MARTRSIRRIRSKPRKNAGFFPESLQAFIARRLVDGVAFGFIAAAAFTALALMTYNSADPSWNTAISQTENLEISNWMGLPGTWIADLFAQTIGIGGAAFAAAFFIWGIRSFRRHPLKPLWARAVALVWAAGCLSVACSQLSSYDWLVHPSLGSVFGAMLFDILQGLADNITSLDPAFAIAGLFATLFTVSFAYACAVTWEEVLDVIHALKTLLLLAGSYVWQGIIALRHWVAKYNDPDYYEPPAISVKLPSFSFQRSKKPRKAPRIETQETGLDAAIEAPIDQDESGIPETPAQSKRKASIPVVAAKTPPKAAQQNTATQTRFALSDEEWEPPPLTLLQKRPKGTEPETMNEESLRKNAELLQNVLADFNVEGDIVSISPGPVVTLYELEPAPGTKSSRVISLSDDIARSMSSVSVRCAVIPGRNVIGIELPNKNRQVVYMEELLSTQLAEKQKALLPLILGKDIGGQHVVADLAKMPHLLVAGTTGSGKSVAVNTMILSLLYQLPPEKCRFIMIDPKMLELSVYDEIPHLLAPVVTEPGKAVVALKWTVHEMEERYRAMSKLGVRNIEGYNARLHEARKNGEELLQKVQTGFDPDTGQPEFEDQPMDLTELPYIVVVVDEFADLMLVAGKDVENAIQRLAQMARAAGIHLIMATQRPSVDVITGVIKANFPTRISFQVTSKIDSRTILGEGGAEQLLGMGDMLYMAPGGRITRVHGPFVSDREVEAVTNFLRQQGTPAYIEGITSGDDIGSSEIMNAMFGGGTGGDSVDELYDQAVALVAREGKASTSFVQRYLQIGYNRAARIIEEMERQGVISKASPTGKREVLVRDFSDV